MFYVAIVSVFLEVLSLCRSEIWEKDRLILAISHGDRDRSVIVEKSVTFP